MNKLTQQDIIDFFTSRPTFDKSETDSSKLYGWPSTRDGLYSITDMYKYFQAKGHSNTNVDDVKYKFFQNVYFGETVKLEKGKTHILQCTSITNFNPDYYKTPFTYYSYNITKEEAFKLKKEYEDESKILMKALIEKRKTTKKSLLSNNTPKKKTTPKPRTKKPALTGITLN